jgi:hypothetical protein
MAGETLTWIDSTSTSHVLDGSSNTNPRSVEGRQGLFMPPTAQLDQRAPLTPGTTVIYTDIQARIVTIPLLVSCTTDVTLRSTLRSMVDDWFSAPGTLRATDPSAVNRDLGPGQCYYVGGLELDESYPAKFTTWVIAPLQLLAADPFWYDTSNTTAGPYTNTQMGSTQVIANGGKVYVYPTWTLTGPFVNMVITNTTTGLKIDLTANGGISLVNGDTLTINTAAGTIVKNSTDNRDKLTTASVLFPLIVGNNSITFTYTGGVNGQTTAQAVFKQRYRSI